jgi:glutamine amidotransferase
MFELPHGLSEPREPGLVMRHVRNRSDRRDWHASGPKMQAVHPETIVFASVPLDEDFWQPLARGTVLALRDGQILARSAS